MALASLEDINVHLPQDKLEVEEAEYQPFQLDAERIVRGSLSGFIPAITMATWLTPETTPELVRAIAGRLVASFQYRKVYSEESMDDPDYAQFKYNEAMTWLTQIQSGEMVLEEIDVSSSTGLGELDFFPNNSTPGPIFTIDSVL